MSKILELPKEIQIMAKHELNEVPEQVEQDITYIRGWLLKQPHINARTDDYSILTFLRACKFSLEKTKYKMELFYTLKTAFPNTFKNRDPLDSKMQYFFKQNLMTQLPHTSNGPIIIFFRIENANADIITAYDGLKLATILVDAIFQEYQESSVVGFAALVDLKNIPARFIFQLTPSFSKQLVSCLQDGYPVTCDMSDGRTAMPSYFPLTVLPTEYGGAAGQLADLCEKSRLLVESYCQWFIEDNQYRSIEEKRPTSSKLRFDLFSIDGLMTQLPHTSNGPIIIFFRIENANADIITAYDGLKLATILVDAIFQEYQESSVVGFAALVDLKNIPARFIFQLTPSFSKQLVSCLQDGYPVTCDMSDGRTAMPSYFPLTVLPTEYGGAAGQLADLCEKSRLLVESYCQWFIEDNQYRSIEEKRPTSSKLRFDLFSIDGSFRKTKYKMELFYTLKTAFPNTFKNRDPLDSKMQYFFKQNLMTQLPHTSNGPIIIFFRIENANADIITAYDGLKLATILVDAVFQEYQESSVVGFAALVDLKNIPTRFIFQLTPSFSKQLVSCLQDGYPVRLKAFHFINIPKVLFAAFSIFKSFLPEKLQERVTCDMSDGRTAMPSYFPLTVLPTEYGGAAGQLADLCACGQCNEQVCLNASPYQSDVNGDDTFDPEILENFETNVLEDENEEEFEIPREPDDDEEEEEEEQN
ncbi:hypothetical protein FQR65_LT10954 [Abscondita terminalis]|nr:hypothetical protein FQR65_LT10954 [Abscondita terminalis]